MNLVFLAPQCWNSWVLSFKRGMIHICSRQSGKAQFVALYSLQFWSSSSAPLCPHYDPILLWNSLYLLILPLEGVFFPFHFSQLENGLWLIPRKPVGTNTALQRAPQNLIFPLYLSFPELGNSVVADVFLSVTCMCQNGLCLCCLFLSAFPAELFTCLSYIFSFLHSVELTWFRSEYLPTFPFLLILGPNVCFSSSSSSAFLKDIVLVETKRSMCSVLIQWLPTFTPLSKVIPVMDKFSINLGLNYGWVIWLPFNVT